MSQARALVNPTLGILGVATGKSSDRAGEATVIFYVDPNSNVDIPQTVGGIRTEVIPTSARAVAEGSAPQSVLEAQNLPALSGDVLAQASATKDQVADGLMRDNPSFFGVGVGQSLDNPKEASLVVYVDRKQTPDTLPPTLDGLRVRYVIMDRLHVTRSYLNGPIRSQSRCFSPATARQPDLLDLINARSRSLVNVF